MLLDKVRADVNKEREVNAVQTAIIVALIHLHEQHRDELAHRRRRRGSVRDRKVIFPCPTGWARVERKSEK